MSFLFSTSYARVLYIMYRRPMGVHADGDFHLLPLGCQSMKRRVSG